MSAKESSGKPPAPTGLRFQDVEALLADPAPDKRQAHSHVKGRRYEGTIRAHAFGLGEESQTKVPGEPVQMTAEGDIQNVALRVLEWVVFED